MSYLYIYIFTVKIYVGIFLDPLFKNKTEQNYLFIVVLTYFTYHNLHIFFLCQF